MCSHAITVLYQSVSLSAPTPQTDLPRRRTKKKKRTGICPASHAIIISLYSVPFYAILPDREQVEQLEQLEQRFFKNLINVCIRLYTAIPTRCKPSILPIFIFFVPFVPVVPLYKYNNNISIIIYRNKDIRSIIITFKVERKVEQGGTGWNKL